jgi:hypothetical protein
MAIIFLKSSLKLLIGYEDLSTVEPFYNEGP